MNSPGFITPPRRARSVAVGATAKAVALSLLPALALSVLGPAPPVDASLPSAQSRASTPVSVLETGAVRGDGRDDLAAFKSAVSRAKAEGRAVFVPRGSFHLSDVLVLDGVAMRGAGRKRTRLISTDHTAATLELTGQGPLLARLKHVIRGPEGRSPLPGRQNTRVQDATSFRIMGVHLVGAKGGGILVRRSHGGVIANSIVARTLADGIHLNQGTTDVLVHHNRLHRTGDDGVAVVSYKSDGAVVERIQIRNNRVYQGKTRGLTVVGGEHVSIEDNTVIESESGGIYIAAEREWNTFGVRDVAVTGNHVSGSPTRNSHASVLVYSSGELINNVRFLNNTVLGSTTTGFGAWLHPNGSGQIGDLYYQGNVVAQNASSLWARTWFRAGRIHASNNTGF